MSGVINLRRIGASDAAAVLGVSDYSTSFDVWLRICEGFRADEAPHQTLGKRFERVIADWWADEEKHRVEWMPSFEPADRAWSRFTPDVRIVGRPEIADIKRARYALDRHPGPPGTDQIHPYELAQLQTQLEGLHHLSTISDVEPIETAHLVCHDLSSDTLMCWRTERDEEFGALIVEECEAFWRDFVETKRRPPITGSVNAKAWIEKRFPRDTNPPRPATEDEARLCTEWRMIAEEGSKLETRIDTIKNELRESIGDARGIKGEFGSISYAAIAEQKKPDWERVALNRIMSEVARQNPGLPASWVETQAQKVLAVEGDQEMTVARKPYRRLAPSWRKAKP